MCARSIIEIDACVNEVLLFVNPGQDLQSRVSGRSAGVTGDGGQARRPRTPITTKHNIWGFGGGGGRHRSIAVVAPVKSYGSGMIQGMVMP